MTTRLFADEADQKAFGHWDQQYKSVIDNIKDKKGGSNIKLDTDNFRRLNRDGDVHLTGDACERLGELLGKSTRWNTFSVDQANMTGNRVAALLRAWMKGRKGRASSSIKTLTLDRNPRIGWGVLSPEQVELVRNMDLKGDDDPHIGSAKMASLASFLTNNVGLRELGLFNVGMDLEGLENIAPSLSTQPSLKYLDVGGNFLGDGGVRTLSKALRKVKSLETLGLSNSNITLYSSIAPLFGEDGVRGIKYLNLSYNRGIGDDFLREMGREFCEHAPLLETLVIRGEDNTFTTDALVACLSEMTLGGRLGNAADANNCLKDVIGVDGGIEAIEKLMSIHRLQKISPAEKARQKIIDHFFSAVPLRQEVLGIDIKLMPHVLSAIACKTPITDLTTRKTPTDTDNRRHAILYNVCRNWNMPSLFYHPSPDKLRIQSLQEENEQLNEQNGALKRKADELGSENDRLREELRRLKGGL